MRRLLLLALLVVALPVASAGAGPQAVASSGAQTGQAGQTLTAPAGFSDTVIASLPTPTGFAWTPDGRMLITQDEGKLRVLRNGTLKATPALDLGPRACTDGERGLAGITLDPAFSTNRHVYLFWTHDANNSCAVGTRDTPVNRVARYTLGDNDVVVAGSEKVIVDHLPSPASNHNGGDLHFGADGLLYISVGDGGCTIGAPTQCAELNTNSRRRDIPNGKILRVRKDGTVPATNPYASASGARRCTAPTGVAPGTGPCSETFASGFRNPFRFVQRPGTSRFLVNDVGQAHWEEIDELAAGKDYGWNTREGHCPTGSTTNCESTPDAFQNPIFDYSHDDGCQSITGGAFVPAGVWPAPYSGSYLFGDFVCGTIFRLVPSSGGGYTKEPFLSGISDPVTMGFGPHGSTQALYWLEYFGGRVHRVSYAAGGNQDPIAEFTSRPDGRTVAFDGSASYDPDAGDAVRSWQWTFGDGTTRTTTTPRVSYTYPGARAYTASLRVVDSRGALSAPVSRTVYAGEHAPVVSITAPALDARFSVGQAVTVRGTATDAEDGALPVTWTVTRKHGTHAHPFLGPVTGASVDLTYPSPEDLASTRNSHLVVTAVATDSRGYSTTTVRTLLPKQVTLSFATSPAGGVVVIGGSRKATPVNIVSWAGWVLQVSAPDQTIDGRAYTFAGWSDGGARTHDITTPASAATYTARFR